MCEKLADHKEAALSRATCPGQDADGAVPRGSQAGLRETAAGPDEGDRKFLSVQEKYCVR